MESKVTFPPHVQTRAFEDVAEQIRDVILGKRVNLGDRLPSERSLAQQFKWAASRLARPNKAIVGANAFAHESGIHQDGLLKEKSTYEIIKPETIGLHATKLVLGKHSGRHAFKTRLKELGYVLTEEELNRTFERFKRLADQKKDIFDEDIEALISEDVTKVPEVYSLIDLYIASGISQKPTATVKLKVGDTIIDRMEYGDGPVDATYKAIA